MRGPPTETLIQEEPQLGVVAVVGKSLLLQPWPQLVLDVLPGVAADAAEPILVLPGRYIIKGRYRRAHVQPPAGCRCVVGEVGTRLDRPSALDRGGHDS
jgi:hypothetical protein